nr:hypothetical protein Iba_chr11aCG19340 [Ipomoea batatas]
MMQPYEEEITEDMKNKILTMMEEFKQDMANMREEWRQERRQRTSSLGQETQASMRTLEDQMAQVAKCGNEEEDTHGNTFEHTRNATYDLHDRAFMCGNEFWVTNEVIFLTPCDFNDNDSFDFSDDDDENCVDTCENNSFNSMENNSIESCVDNFSNSYDSNSSNPCENNSFVSLDDNDGLESFTFDRSEGVEEENVKEEKKTRNESVREKVEEKVRNDEKEFDLLINMGKFSKILQYKGYGSTGRMVAGKEESDNIVELTAHHAAGFHAAVVGGAGEVERQAEHAGADDDERVQQPCNLVATLNVQEQLAPNAKGGDVVFEILRSGFTTDCGHHVVRRVFSLVNKNLFAAAPQNTATFSPSIDVLKTSNEYFFILSDMYFSGPDNIMSMLSPTTGQPVEPGGTFGFEVLGLVMK